MPLHHGGCHCGAVRFEADLELEGLMTCNCSICGKTGAIMAFIPAEQMRQTAGHDCLTDYQFGQKAIHHSFCKVCGVRSFAQGSRKSEDGKVWAMVNVRCLDGVDAHALEVGRRHDGKNL